MLQLNKIKLTQESEKKHRSVKFGGGAAKKSDLKKSKIEKCSHTNFSDSITLRNATTKLLTEKSNYLI